MLYLFVFAQVAPYGTLSIFGFPVQGSINIAKTYRHWAQCGTRVFCMHAWKASQYHTPVKLSILDTVCSFNT